jgi:hypothetical protein
VAKETTQPIPEEKKKKLRGIIPLTPKIILCMKEFWELF